MYGVLGVRNSEWPPTRFLRRVTIQQYYNKLSHLARSTIEKLGLHRGITLRMAADAKSTMYFVDTLDMNQLGEYSVHVQRCSGGSGVLCIITVLIRSTRSCHITSFFSFFLSLFTLLPFTLLPFSTCHLTGVNYLHSSRPLLELHHPKPPPLY